MMDPEERDRLTRLESQVSQMEAVLKDLALDTKKLLAASNMAGGAWWALMKVAGILVVIAGAVSWLVDHVGPKLRFAALAAAILAFGAMPAARAQSVIQSGSVTPGHLPTWVTSGVIKDGGTSSNPQVNALGLYGNGGCPLGIASTTVPGTPSGNYVLGCLSSSSSAGVTLSVTPNGLSTKPLVFDINGTSYSMGGSNWLSAWFDDQFGSTGGDILCRDGSNWSALAPGTSGQVLFTQGSGSCPVWGAAAGTGTVVQVNTGSCLTGGPITTSGTISLSTPASVACGGTGQSSLSAHYVLVGNGTSGITAITPDTLGYCLISNGTSADPTFQSCNGGGTVSSVDVSGGTTGLTTSGGPITSTGTITIAGTLAVGSGGTGATTASAARVALGATGALAGTAVNPKMSVTAASASGTFTADQVIVYTALNGDAMLLPSYSQGINLATTGAGGMDTGSAPVSGFVSLYAIAKPDGTTSILACAVATSTATIYAGANMPSGYTYSGLIGVFPTNGSSQFPISVLMGRTVSFVAASALSGGTSATYASVDISSLVPPNAKTALATLSATYVSAGGLAFIASDSNGVASQLTPTTQSGDVMRNNVSVPLITAQTVYYKTSNTGSSVSITVYGYTF